MAGSAAACAELDVTEVDRLEAQIGWNLNGRVHDFRLLARESGLIIQGLARTYYAKQIAQHMVMKSTSLPILANEIEVT